MTRIICSAFGYRVYYDYDRKRYILDLYIPITHSYATLEDVAEALYYIGYIPVKDIGALNAFKGD